jgi:hypothetical protein
MYNKHLPDRKSCAIVSLFGENMTAVTGTSRDDTVTQTANLTNLRGLAFLKTLQSGNFMVQIMG